MILQNGRADLVVLSVSEVLARAADLVEPEGAWAQGTYARDSNGNRCSVTDANATSWCMIGAVWAASGTAKAQREADSFIRKQIPGHLPGLWNDDPKRSQQEIVDLLREASTRAREYSA